ncbi:unnamed protein product [Phaeothamnion confervicola]
MSLFEESGNTDVEGVTTVNACYGGTAALLNAVAWVESSGWDGRYAVVVAADIAVYAEGPARPTGGCGAVAVLIGPDAPLPISMGLRTTHACDVWDFFKPDMSSEYPAVNGALSQTCYLRALDDCYGRLAAKLERVDSSAAAVGSGMAAADASAAGAGIFTREAVDYFVFHAPYNKLVQKSYARLLLSDAKRLAAAGAPLPPALAPLAPWLDRPAEETYMDRELEAALKNLAAAGYERQAAPSCRPSKQIGNTYTASVFANLVGLVDAVGAALDGCRVLVFSYGSGAVATMYEIRPRRPGPDGPGAPFTLERLASAVDLKARLAARDRLPPAELAAALDARAAMHHARGAEPTFPVNRLFPGTYYLARIEADGIRKYTRAPVGAARVAGDGPVAPAMVAAAAAGGGGGGGSGADDVATTDESVGTSEGDDSASANGGKANEAPETTTAALTGSKAAAAAGLEAAGNGRLARGVREMPRVVVTGVACGLPGQEKVFMPDNLNRLLEGRSCIAPLCARTKAALLEKNVVELRKTKAAGNGGAPATERVPITTPGATIQLAARLGRLDLTQYGVSPSIAATMDKAVQVAVAAGLEALRDAGLVRGNDCGNGGGGGAWRLAEHLRDGTGVMYASSFPALDAAIGEVMRFLRSRCITRARKSQLLAALRERLRASSGGSAVSPEDEHALRSLEKAVITRSTVNLLAMAEPALDAAANSANGNDNGTSNGAGRAGCDAAGGGGEEVAPVAGVIGSMGGLGGFHGADAEEEEEETESLRYEFDRKFLFRVLVLGNAQLAQIVGARGPNMQTNAACAGSTQALAVAQDMLQLGRCERMVVIAGDDASGEALIPWIGNGFRALGAASIAGDVAGAALPFDARRNGMLLGAGAIGMVIETEASAARRHCEAAGLRTVANGAASGGGGSGRPAVKARLLETQISNSAFHGASMDKNHIAVELERFLGTIQENWGVTREQIARQGVYFSHETCTHATPTASCAYNEVFALRRCFGSDLLPHMTIINTKGFTGHPMGVSFEDVAAVEVLLSGVAPPVGDHCRLDPALGDLKLSRGGPVGAKYALRFAAGFGSQVAFALYAAVDI